MIRRSQKPNCLLTNERGATAVEFSMIVAIFFSIVIASYMVGLYFLTKNRLQQGVEDAVRYAAVHSTATDDELEDIVREVTEVINANNSRLDVDISTETLNGVNFIEISASYDFDWNLPFVPESFNDLELEVSARSAR